MIVVYLLSSRQNEALNLRNLTEQGQFWFCTLKTMPIELQWLNFDFELEIEIKTILVKMVCKLLKFVQKKGIAMFFCTQCCENRHIRLHFCKKIA